MEIRLNTESYNQRRWGKHWIANVDFTSNPNGDFTFGDWVGDHYKGSEGILIIDTVAGNIIAKGQKDNRGRGTSRDYYIALSSGELEYIGDKAAAYKRSLEAKKPNAMKRAWEIRREAAVKFCCKVSEISMGECLKVAWAEIKNS